MYTTSIRIVLIAALIASAPLAGVAQSGRVRKPAPPPASAQPDPTPPAASGTSTAPATTVADPAPAPRKAPVVVVFETQANYEGGTLALEGDEKLLVAIKNGILMFKTKQHVFEVAAERVQSMSYGTAVRERTAEGVGVGVLVPGAGGVISKLKTTKHYIELVWSGDAGAPDAGAVLRVDKDKYRGLIAALEAATGLQIRMEPAPLVKDFPTY